MSRGSRGRRMESLEYKRIVEDRKERIAKEEAKLARHLSGAYEQDGLIYFQHTSPYDGFRCYMSAEVQYLHNSAEWEVVAIHTKDGEAVKEHIENEHGRLYYLELEKALCKLMENP